MKKNKIFLLKVLSFFTFIFILSFLILLKKDIFLKLFGNLILFEDPIKNDDVLIQVIDNEGNINGGTDDDEIKKPLSTVLTTTQLGKLDNQNSETIQQAIKKANAPLEQSGLEIKEITETTAKVTASDYLGEVTVSYEIEKPLSTVLTTTQLGKLDNQNSETIQQAIKEKNESLDKDIQLVIQGMTETTAKVTASDYLGEVTVSYEIKKPLSTVLTTTQLGKLDNQNSETIQQAIKKANAPLEQSGLEIKEITETTAKVTASDYLGEVTVSYEIKKPLSTVLTTTQLGKLDNQNSETIQQAIKKANAPLEQSGLEIKEITETTAKVTASDYLGEVTVSYEIKKPLSTVLTTTQLGKLDNQNSETIQQAIKKANAPLEQSGLEIKEITETTAKVTASDYLGEVTVSYEIEKPLSTVLTTTQLGKLDNQNSETIQQAIKEKNESLDKDIQLVIQGMTETTAKVTASDYLGEVTVSYEIKKPLSTVLTTTQLGKLDNQNSETIQQAIKEKNESLDKDIQLVIQGMTETTAKVTASDYLGEVTVSYEIKKPLSTVLTTTQLGKLDNQNSETIQQAIKEKNESLDKDIQLVIQGMTETTAKVTASDYLGEVTVSYEIKKPLSTVLTTTQLGKLDNQNSETIQQAIKEKNESLDKDIQLVIQGMTETTAKVTASDYLGEVTVSYEIKKPLSTVLTTTQLGKLDNQNSETIQQAIKKANAPLEQSGLEIKEITETTAKVTASDYLGEVTVSYEIKKPLSTVLTTTQLGKLDNQNSETIQQAIKKANAPLEQSGLEIKEITETTAKVTASDYLGEVTVSYEIKKPLSTVLTTTQLGKLDNQNSETIQQAIKEKNESLDKDIQLVIQGMTETTAKVTASDYLGEVTVSYEIKKPLSTVLTTTQLGKLDNQNSETIQQAIKKANAPLEQSGLEIKEITETTAKVTASDYLGEVTVSYEIKKPLSTVLTTTQLGKLDNQNSETIQQAIKKANAPLEQSGLEIKEITETTAKVTASDYLGEVTVSYEIKKPLSTVLTTTQLGKLDNQNSETIQQAIKEKNESLDKDIQLVIQGMTETTAKVTASDYLGEVTVSYEIKKPLSTVLTTTQLGKLDNQNSETIQQAIKEKNESLDKDIQLVIQGMTETTAKVTASDYLGEVTVSYEIKKPLSTVLTTTQLGKLDNQNSETIQQAIKKANAPLEQSGLEIKEITETTAKVTASDYLGEVTVSYEIKKPLSTVLTTTQLGKLDNQNSETIQQAIKKANAPLEQSGLEIKEITETTAKVTASDYLGEVTVSYEIKKPLSTVLTTTQLGKLDNQNSETIQQAIKKANAPLEQSGLEIKEITETTAKVTASDYLGEVTVSYEIKKPLSTVLTTTQLGKLDNQNSETIQQAIKEKNESLDKDIQLVIQGMTETTAKVTASDYLGEVTVSYEIEKPLSTVLTTTQLGKLDNQNSETIQQAIKKANAPLEQSGLEIKEITETTAKVTASDYLGEVTVSYEIKKPLSTVLTTTQLGKLDNQNSETIQQAIKKANAPLEQSGLEIKEITETTAKVTASDYLGEVTVSYEIEKPLSTVLTTTQLGKLDNQNSETIQQAIKEKNESLDKDIQLVIQGMTETTAKVTASDYLGEVTVSYEIKKPLSTVLTTTQLGKLDNQNSETIQQAIKEKNESLDKDIQLVIQGMTETTAKVTASDYLGEVTVSYEIKKPLSTVLTTTQLGKLDNQNSETIQQAIKKANAPLEQSGLEIKEITETTAKVTASDYLGEVTVSYETVTSDTKEEETSWSFIILMTFVMVLIISSIVFFMFTKKNNK